MSDPHPSERYSFIKDKNPREIVLLRGSGCRWRRCRFCNYHLDFSHDQTANDRLNFDVLSRVAGITGVLEAINSGSFSDLSENTLAEIVRVCEEKNIQRLHVECHWQDRAQIAPFRTRLAAHGIALRVKGGLFRLRAAGKAEDLQCAHYAAHVVGVQAGGALRIDGFEHRVQTRPAVRAFGNARQFIADGLVALRGKALI